jgi:RecA/RadA recombinase
MKKDSSLKSFKLNEMPTIPKLPSYIFSFDYLTGGLPLGRFTLLWGDKSVSKSTFSYRLIKSFLKHIPDKKVLYMDFENALDPEWAKHIIGEDDGRLDVVIPAYAEEGMEFLVEDTQEGNHNFIIIDSLAMLVPVKETESAMDSALVGIQARTINSLLRKIVPNISIHNRNGNTITTILINQLRSKINAFGGGSTMPGGHLQEAISSLILKFYSGGTTKDDGSPVKATYEFIVEKNKTGGIPKSVGSYSVALQPVKFYNTGDVIDALTIIDYCKKTGLLIKDKNTWTMDGESYKTQLEIEKKLHSDLEFKLHITNLLKEVKL